jgi:hypothetical protein
MPVTIGYLGRPEKEASRAEPGQAAAGPLPALLRPALPVLRNGGGTVFETGAGPAAGAIVFAPANPLSNAGFTVV